MRSLLALALLAVGCASSPITITYAEGKGAFGGPKPVLQSVTVDPRSYGRSCFDVEVDTDGSVVVTYAVDASSDYAGIRVLPAIIPEIVSAVMAVVGAPIDVIGELLGVEREEMAEPSALSACSAIFED